MAELKQNELWWHGTIWLKLPRSQWPQQKTIPDIKLEFKSVKSFITTTLEDPLDRFLSLSRAYRVLVCALRWWRSTGTRRSTHFIDSMETAQEEIRFVKNRLLMWTQKQHYPEEYHRLSQRLPISSKSILLPFNPFIDTNGVFRANGRLMESTTLTYNERHPIPLPHTARISRLL